jgi:hypothetical protein
MDNVLIDHRQPAHCVLVNVVVIPDFASTRGLSPTFHKQFTAKAPPRRATAERTYAYLL